MKPTKLGELTTIHDPQHRFGLEDMYVHVRVGLPPDHSQGCEWLATFEEVARMEGRAERGLEFLPECKHSSYEGVFMAGAVIGVIVTCTAWWLGKLL